MANLNCPSCGESNPGELEACLFCGSQLRPVPESEPEDNSPNLLDEIPEEKQISNIEKEIPASDNLFELGKAPTRKNTAELELTLPEWLRSLRKGQDLAESVSQQDTSSNQDLPLGNQQPGSSEERSDWLSGLNKASSEDEEEIPEWLTSLHNAETGKSAGDPAPAQDPSISASSSLPAGSEPADWTIGLGKTISPEMSDQPPVEQSGIEVKNESLEVLDSLSPQPVPDSIPEQPAVQPAEEVPGWLNDLSGSPEDNKPFSNQLENLPDWLNHLQDKPLDSNPPRDEKAGFTAPAVASEGLSPQGTPNEPSNPAGVENLPDWLSNLQGNTDRGSQNIAQISNQEPPPSNAPRQEIPDWLSQFQVDLNAAGQLDAQKDQFEVPSQTTENGVPSEPLPDWLSQLKQSEKPSDGIPALISSEESVAQKETGELPFSIETPDWLSKLNPEKAAERTTGGSSGASVPEDLEFPELPSWVQAMRPVESVVGDTKTTPQEDVQVSEQSGPLAGLQGVLPSTPGLGVLRKPPPYSTVLQVSDGQQRYSAAFERLISNETQPQAPISGRIFSNRLWRWLIAALMLLAVGLPIIAKIPVTRVSGLQSPEMLDAMTVINNLPSTSPNKPVLVVFDYEPALSGELEAAAAPLMERLLLQDPSLALISTNPTGPALAEHFLQNISPSALIDNQQYVNLGYLAGGPAGVQYFAISPTTTVLFSHNGQPAWQMPPLSRIQRLSDFAAIIVLTDNADSGRVWIEQTGSVIGSTPMLMVISAQVEPMILPYYDSSQIQGLVTGLAGGEAYNQSNVRKDGQVGLAHRYWNSFSSGILVAELLIIIGALQSGMVARRKRRNKSGPGS